MSTTLKKEDVSKPKFFPFLGIKNFSMITAANAILLTITAYSIGGSIGSNASIDNTIKMCNIRPAECKFKYDILIYQETGKVPVVQTKTTLK
jgi:hypothetical protein